MLAVAIEAVILDVAGLLGSRDLAAHHHTVTVATVTARLRLEHAAEFDVPNQISPGLNPSSADFPVERLSRSLGAAMAKDASIYARGHLTLAKLPA